MAFYFDQWYNNNAEGNKLLATMNAMNMYRWYKSA